MDIQNGYTPSFIDNKWTILQQLEAIKKYIADKGVFFKLHYVAITDNYFEHTYNFIIINTDDEKIISLEKFKKQVIKIFTDGYKNGSIICCNSYGTTGQLELIRYSSSNLIREQVSLTNDGFTFTDLIL